MPGDEPIRTHLVDGVFTIVLNRPKANAFNEAMIKAVQDAFMQAKQDQAVRCVLLTGEGNIFSAGQDVKEFQGSSPVSFRQHLQHTYTPLILQIRRIEKPVLAAINGAVAGAALGIALACDLRIAADSARFLVGFLGIGLALDSAVSLLLPALVGLGRATEATFDNQPIDAQQALDWGLVNRVAPQDKLMVEANEWAAALAQGPVRAMGLTKRAVNRAVLPQLEAVLDYEAQIQEIAGHGPDHKEGLAAFREKRPPIYT